MDGAAMNKSLIIQISFHLMELVIALLVVRLPRQIMQCKWLDRSFLGDFVQAFAGADRLTPRFKDCYERH